MDKSLFLDRDLQDWLESNGKVAKCLLPRNPPSKLVFLFAIWLVWKNRNHMVFKGKSQNSGLATEIKN